MTAPKRPNTIQPTRKATTEPMPKCDVLMETLTETTPHKGPITVGRPRLMKAAATHTTSAVAPAFSQLMS
jgi:hypothetical protein